MASGKARTRSEKQLTAAEPQFSVWVGASAGSGKTSVLSDRVLRLLLLDGAKPERLLCLTFTKAAAAEMKTRVMGELAHWAASDDAEIDDSLSKLLGRRVASDECVRARRLFARALDAPGGLKIQTIHGFCQSLLGRFPLEANVVPYFDLAEERVADELMAEARARVLKAAEAGGPLADALAIATARAGEERFEMLVDALARERGRLMRLVQDHGVDGAVGQIFARHGADPTTVPGDLLAEATGDKALDLPALRRACDALTRGSVTDQKRGAVLSRFLAEPKRRLAMFDDYRLVFLKKTDGQIHTNLATKSAEAHDPGIKATMRTEAERVLALDGRLKALAVARSTAALVRLAVSVVETYGRLKDERALLDYDDLILRTRDLLSMEGVAPWVLFKLDGGLDHILIDEAQDTNPDQWHVIERLAEEFFAGSGAREVERTVFAVGDYKQSIYGFQRADPNEFQRMRLHFALRVGGANREWREVQLETSFRSTPAVLSFVDEVFAKPGARTGVSPEGAEIRHVPHRKGTAGLVELWPLVEPADRTELAPWSPPVDQREGDDPETRLARVIARRIHEWVDQKELLPARGRAIRPGDVMVLVRRRGTFLDALVKALKQLQVPVAGADRILLTDQLAVMDLMALGHALLLPSDDLTLATVLKGPLIGLSEDQLFRLAHGRDGSLWRRLAQLREEDAAFARAHDLIADLLARVDLMPPFALFAYVLGPLGGRRAIQSRLGPEALDALEEFLNAVLAHERVHPPSLQGFLHWLALAAEDIKRDLEHGVRDEVRVMTVHGAKGLQAPIVILPDTVAPFRDDPGVLWTEDGLPVWCPRAEEADAVAARARAAARTRAEEEHRRLLYVAMTRAEDRLYIGGWRNSDRRTGSASWYDLVSAAVETLPGVKPVVERPARRYVTAQDAPVEPPKPAAAAAATPGLPDWTRKAPRPEPTPPRPLAPSRPEDPEPPVRSPLIVDDALRFRRGRLIHRLLQSLPDLEPEARPAAARRWLGRPGQGLTPAEVATLLAETLAILEDPALRPLFGPGSRPEVPITGVVGPHVVSGQVDRLVALEGRVLVVDYKTNRPAPTDVARVAPLYLRQMAAYRAVLTQIYPGRTVECLLLWTETPRLMALPDALLDRYKPG